MLSTFELCNLPGCTGLSQRIRCLVCTFFFCYSTPSFDWSSIVCVFCLCTNPLVLSRHWWGFLISAICWGSIPQRFVLSWHRLCYYVIYTPYLFWGLLLEVYASRPLFKSGFDTSWHSSQSVYLLGAGCRSWSSWYQQAYLICKHGTVKCSAWRLVV